MLGCALLVSALLLRRRPLVALAVMLGGAVAAIALGPGPGQTPPLQIVLAAAAGTEICYIAAARPRAVSVTGLAMAGAALLIPGPGGVDLGPFRGGAVVVTIVAWLIGHSIRQAQARAELQRAQAAAQTTLAERLRLADPGPGPGQAPPGPAPGLADIGRLAATALDAGVKVEVDWRGSREPLPADIDLSAFRIIQEAVTNVVRHAGTSQCQVLIGQRDGQLSIEVTDSGRGAPVSKITAAGTGYGITGMRERAALLGGDFSAGPRPGGGFRVAARGTHARVLVLTTFDDDDYVYGALRAGASGFLVKDMALEDILTAVRVVAAGDAMIAPGVTRRLIGHFTSEPPSGRKPRDLTGITDREREVLRLVGLGMSNAEIAAALHITGGTAKTHVARLLAKLAARDRVQLVITAYEAGLVSASR